jgi:hypothetical protein
MPFHEGFEPSSIGWRSRHHIRQEWPTREGYVNLLLHSLNSTKHSDQLKSQGRKTLDTDLLLLHGLPQRPLRLSKIA